MCYRLAAACLLFACTLPAVAQRTLDLGVGLGASHFWAEEGSRRGLVFGAEDIGFAARGSAALGFALSERNTLSVGFRYALLTSRQESSGGALRWGAQWDGQAFDPTKPSGEPDIRSLVLTERVSLLEFPVALRRALSTRPSHFYAQAGLTPALLSRAGGSFSVDGEGDGFRAYEDASPAFWLAANLAFGYHYQCGERVGLFGQVMGNVQVLEDYPDAGSRRWDATMQVGLRMGL